MVGGEAAGNIWLRGRQAGIPVVRLPACPRLSPLQTLCPTRRRVWLGQGACDSRWEFAPSVSPLGTPVWVGQLADVMPLCFLSWRGPPL